MRRFTLNTTLTGKVVNENQTGNEFVIKCRSGDEFIVSVGRETQFRFVQNLDGVDRDRIPNPESFSGTPQQLIAKYIQPNRLVTLQGIYLEDGDKKRFDARTVTRILNISLPCKKRSP